ncbi:HDOD domain-containing protein [Methylomonas sp. MgM2]
MSPTQPLQRTETIEEWTELLRVEELPIFSNTAQKLYASLDDKKKGALELASIILQDPNLTTKLLKIANSPYYNPARQKISTVSRAIVILGLEMIRELTLACSFFESILSSADKDRANKEIAVAIHSAVQARELAIAMGDKSPEEVFVAALLHNIGHIAFWCSSNRKIVEIHELIRRCNLNGQEAEKNVLGFSLADLGKKLSKSWHLGGLIDEAIKYPDSQDKRIQTVRMGELVCDAIVQGWDSEAMEECLKKLNKFSEQPIESLKAKIKANISKAANFAQQFGAHEASRYISPQSGFSAPKPVEEEHPDKKQIQFQILQDITSHISGNIDLNVLFEMVLEGIHRGLEMDRTMFMLLASDKKSLNEKISLGWQKSGNVDKIRILNSELSDNLLFHALSQSDGCWFKPSQHAALYTNQVENNFGRYECFAFSIQVEHKPIGLIYCDRAVNNGTLTIEEFSIAKHFANQAQIGLTLYRIKTQ